MAKKVRHGGGRPRRLGGTLIRTGIFAGSGWRLRLGLVLVALGWLRRAIRRDEVIVYSEELEEGGRLLLTHHQGGAR